MKTIIATGLLILCIGTIMGEDLESYQLIERLLRLNGPGAPIIYEDTVIFTASSSYRRVGISFAHEGFSKVHWLKKFVILGEVEITSSNRNVDPYVDTGILFHVQAIPNGMEHMDYRMIIDGLWTADPLNTKSVIGSGGLLQSRVSVPPRSRPTFTFDLASGFTVSYTAPPGEFITLAGSFNGWDPFMYQMKETKRGLDSSLYSLTLPLPAGTYEYVFIHRGERFIDPLNPFIVYTRDGKSASQAQVR